MSECAEGRRGAGRGRTACGLSFLVVVGLWLLSGCSGDDLTGTLHVEDVPGATSVEERRAMSRVSMCQAVTDAELLASYRPVKEVVELPVEDGVTVVTAAIEDFSDASLREIDEGIDECIDRNDEQGTTTTRLTGLPNGVIGFEAVTRTTPENDYGTRLWTYEDERLVAVGLVRPESTPDPDIDLVELLATAVERSMHLREKDE